MVRWLDVRTFRRPVRVKATSSCGIHVSATNVQMCLDRDLRRVPDCYRVLGALARISNPGKYLVMGLKWQSVVNVNDEGVGQRPMDEARMLVVAWGAIASDLFHP